jgi:hypothetical protein
VPQESLLQQENALGRGYSDVLAELATKAAQARARCLDRPFPQCCCRSMRRA